MGFATKFKVIASTTQIADIASRLQVIAPLVIGMMVLAALFGVSSVVGGLYLCVWLYSAGGGRRVDDHPSLRPPYPAGNY
nr:hypothetical protein [uncultured Desulfobulbus sp.]